RARNKIRHWLTEQESEKAIELGRKMVEKEARKYKQSVKELLEGGKLDAILPEYGSSKIEDLLSAIGYGKVSAKQVIARLVPDGDGKVEGVWAGAAPDAESDEVPLTIVTEDRPGMLAEIAAAISDVKANMLNVEARTADERGTIDITVEIPDMNHLERVIMSIKKIDGVYDVSRSTKTLNIAR